MPSRDQPKKSENKPIFGDGEKDKESREVKKITCEEWKGIVATYKCKYPLVTASDEKLEDHNTIRRTDIIKETTYDTFINGSNCLYI